MSTSAPKTKQQKLADSIGKSVAELQRAEFATLKTQIGAEFASLKVSLEMISARIAVVEGLFAEGKTATGGRAIHGAKKTGASAKATKAVDPNDPYAKVKNSMLFCRVMWADNKEFHDAYNTKEAAAIIGANEKVTAKASGSRPRLLVEGSCLWKNCLTPKQKLEIKNKFAAWKKAREIGAIPLPLPIDAGKAPDKIA